MTFDSNTVRNNVDGFYLEAETGFTLNVAASVNRIINNSNSAVTQASGAGFTGTLNGVMENNWWGCNTGPNTAGCGVVTGAGVDFNPWIVLGVSASPNPIAPFGNSTVTADMTDNSNAADTTSFGFLPQMPVAWTATQGTMSPTAGTVTSDLASSTFTSSSNVPGTACAMVDSQQICTNINLKPPIVTIIPNPAPTANDNDYTRINDAVQASFNGQVIKLLGTFNWTEPNAAASWATGSNYIANDIDDYSILVPANLNNVTFTADNLGDATIQGPGDLPGLDLEGVFFFFSTSGAEKNQGWTISNIRFLDFDLTIGMFVQGGASDAFQGTHIFNNYIRMARDVATAGDTLQNIGIQYSFGMNQIINGNTIDIPGDGVSVAGNNSRGRRHAVQHQRRQCL